MEGALMAIERPGRMSMQVEVDLMCRVDSRHTLGKAVFLLDPHPRAGQLLVGNGVRLDGHDKVVVDCPRCASKGKGGSQQISRARIIARAHELLAANKDNGKLQV